MAKTKKKKKTATKKPAKKKAAKPKYAKVTVKKFRVDELEDAPYNSRTITQDALTGLAHSLDEFGLLSLPVVNVRKEGPRVVGGHQRIKILREAEAEFVHCIVVEFDDDVERRANFTLNNRAIQGEFIPELAKEILDKLRDRMGDDKKSLFKRLNFDKLVKKISREIGTNGSAGTTPVSEGATDDDAEPAPTKTKALSKHGAFYRLGEHVIYCGVLHAKGSLHGFPVEDRADMAFTRIAEKKELKQDFLDMYLGHVIENTDGAIYVVTNMESLAQVQRRFQDLNGHWSTTLLWLHPDAKPRAGVAYKNAAIPVVYGWPEGNPHVFYGEKRISNILNLQRTPKNDVPVEIAVKAMLLSSEKEGTILDVDVGSGSTVIAAEKTGRHLLGYARTAHQCDTVRKRWAEYTEGKDCKWESLTPEIKL